MSSQNPSNEVLVASELLQNEVEAVMQSLGLPLDGDHSIGVGENTSWLRYSDRTLIYLTVPVGASEIGARQIFSLGAHDSVYKVMHTVIDSDSPEASWTSEEACDDFTVKQIIKALKTTVPEVKQSRFRQFKQNLRDFSQSAIVHPQYWPWWIG